MAESTKIEGNNLMHMWSQNRPKFFYEIAKKALGRPVNDADTSQTSVHPQFFLIPTHWHWVETRKQKKQWLAREKSERPSNFLPSSNSVSGSSTKGRSKSSQWPVVACEILQSIPKKRLTRFLSVQERYSVSQPQWEGGAIGKCSE